MSLPIFHTQIREFSMHQTQWSSVLDPLLSNPVIAGVLLKNVTLVIGANVINHKLGRPLQGWVPVRLRSSVTIFDTQDANQLPELTLQLTASAAAIIDLYVF